MNGLKTLHAGTFVRLEKLLEDYEKSRKDIIACYTERMNWKIAAANPGVLYNSIREIPDDQEVPANVKANMHSFVNHMYNKSQVIPVRFGQEKLNFIKITLDEAFVDDRKPCCTLHLTKPQYLSRDREWLLSSLVVLVSLVFDDYCPDKLYI